MSLNHGMIISQIFESVERHVDVAGYIWPLTQMMASPAHKLLGTAQVILGLGMLILGHVSQLALQLAHADIHHLRQWEVIEREGADQIKHGVANFIRGWFEELGLVAAMSLLAIDYQVDLRLGHKIFHYKAASGLPSRPAFNAHTYHTALYRLRPWLEPWMIYMGRYNPFDREAPMPSSPQTSANSPLSEDLATVCKPILQTQTP